MLKTTKILLIIAASLIALSILLCIITITAKGWDFSTFGEAGLEATEYEIQDSFSNIKIESETNDIRFHCSEDGKAKVIFRHRKNESVSTVVIDGTLSILVEDRRAWYDIFDLNFADSAINVYLPEKVYGNLAISESTGDISIPDSFIFESINISASTGDLTCSASASEDIKITLSTGDISLSDASAKNIELTTSTGRISVLSTTCEMDARINVSTGSVYINNLTCTNLYSTGNTGEMNCREINVSHNIDIQRSTGDVEIDGCNSGKTLIETSTGDIEIKRCFANEISINASTGDVVLSLLSEMILIVRSDTGDIDVPRGTSGGICEITTDTGDIDVMFLN